MVDATDLKSVFRKEVRVRYPPPAPQSIGAGRHVGIWHLQIFSGAACNEARGRIGHGRRADHFRNPGLRDDIGSQEDAQTEE